MLFYTHVQQTKLSDILKPKFEQVFNHFDHDKNGYIDMDEMKTFAKAIARVTFGVNIEGDELESMVSDMLKDLDLNNDKSIKKFSN